MASLVDRLAAPVVRVLFRSVEVSEVDELDARFRRVCLHGDLAGVDWRAGQKVQVRTGGFTTRTYTPFDWSGDDVSLLVYHHRPSTPAGAWIDGLSVGATCELFGPRSSLAVHDLPAPPIVCGDETSFALGAAIADRTTPVAQLYEASDATAIGGVLASVGLGEATVVERTADDDHLDHLADRLLDAVRAHPEAPLVLTGRAQTIRHLRVALKDAGLRPPVTRVKAYWDVNRSGLD